MALSGGLNRGDRLSALACSFLCMCVYVCCVHECMHERAIRFSDFVAICVRIIKFLLIKLCTLEHMEQIMLLILNKL